MVIQKTILFIILLGNLITNAQAINIYVSPSGNDSGNGSSISPFPTISKAKEYVAQTYINANMSQDVVINIAAGVYPITLPIHFTDADSGKNGKKVHYVAAQNAYLTSGVAINNSTGNVWTLDSSHPSQNVWQMNIGNLYSRQVYRNGIKSKRANNKNNNCNFFESNVGYFASCNIDNFFNWTLNSRQILDLEMVSNSEWKSNRIPINGKCQSQLSVNDLFRYLNDMYSCNSTASWLENSNYLINEPDEWYIDRSVSPNKIYYKTASNSQPGEIIIPTLESLITGDGASNIVFEGLIFQYTTWVEPSSNFENISYPNVNSNFGLFVKQADVYFNSNSSTTTNTTTPGSLKQIPAAVSFKNSNNLSFINNKFEHIGSSGLLLGGNCSNNKICNNIFTDICASGIVLGNRSLVTDYPPTSAILTDSSENNLIQNNTISNIANEYNSSVGIFVCSAKSTTIRNNDISNFPYTGISIGWGWNSLINHNKSIIENNKIDCSNQTMRDGGAIYTLSKQGLDANNRTIIRKNFIKNHHVAYGAIYLDQGSTNISVTENVIKVDPTYYSANPSINWLDNVNWIFVQQIGNDCKNINIDNNFFNNPYPTTPTLPTNYASNNVTLFNNVNGNNTTIENTSGINLLLQCQ